MNSIILALRAESTVSVIWSDRSFSSLEIHSLVQSGPGCSMVVWSELAELVELLDMAVLSVTVAVHLVLVLLFCCPSSRRRRRPGRRATAVRSALPSSVLNWRVISGWASPSRRHAGVAVASVQPGSG